MNDQLKSFLETLLFMLVGYRMESSDSRGGYRDWGKWGRISGRIELAHELGLITLDQQHLLFRLLSSASDCLGRPFPHLANVGPVMPFSVKFDRSRLVKPQAHVSTYDPESVPAPAAPGQLHLLSVLVQNRNGTARLLPVHALRPMPPRVGVSGRFDRALVAQAGFHLRETHARRPAAKVVVRDSRLGQANAIRADLRAVRAGGLSE